MTTREELYLDICKRLNRVAAKTWSVLPETSMSPEEYNAFIYSKIEEIKAIFFDLLITYNPRQNVKDWLEREAKRRSEMRQKTFDVDVFRLKVNGMLAKSTCSKEERKVMQLLLEDVLFKTNNYKGFSYLTSKDIPEGHLPGINDNFEDEGERFTNTDSSRVYYF